MTPSTRVLVLRHGESESNVAGVWSGDPVRNPLTPAGISQARAAGERLRREGVSAVYGSTILRATQTAAEIAGVLGLEHVVVDGVQEMHLGVYEEAHEDVVLPVALRHFDSWLVEGDLDERYEGGESAREVVARLGVALTAVATRHPGETVVVVSHGGTMLVGLTLLCDNLAGTYSEHRVLHNTSVVELVHEGGTWTCVSWSGAPVGPAREEGGAA